MITSAVRGAWSLFVTGVVLYFVFCIPIGHRTIAEHLFRIAGTDEAKELREDVRGAGERLGGEIARQVHRAVVADGGVAP